MIQAFFSVFLLLAAGGDAAHPLNDNKAAREAILRADRERIYEEFKDFLDPRKLDGLSEAFSDVKVLRPMLWDACASEARARFTDTFERHNDLAKSLESGVFFDLDLALKHRGFVRGLMIDAAGKELESLPHLEFLRVFESLSKEPLDLPRLRHLGLDGPNLIEFPDWIWQLDKLEAFEIGGGHTSIPEGIGKLKNLRFLDLSESKRITRLPPSIGELSSLRSLDLEHSAVSELPPEIGKLSNLERLNFYRTPIKTLPPEIGQLRSLRTLRGTFSELTSLPREVGNLKNLVELEVGLGEHSMDCPWEELATLPKLESLHCAGRSEPRPSPQWVGRLERYMNGHYMLPSPKQVPRPLDPYEFKERILRLHAAHNNMDIFKLLLDLSLIPWTTNRDRSLYNDYFHQETTVAVDIFEEELLFLPREKKRLNEVVMQIRLTDELTSYHALALFYRNAEGVWTFAPRTFTVPPLEKAGPPFRFSFAPTYGSKDPRRGLVGTIRDVTTREFTEEVVALWANPVGLFEDARATLSSPSFEATENGSYRLIINPRSAAIRIRFCPQDKCRTKTLRL